MTCIPYLIELVELQLDSLHAAGYHGVHLGDLLALGNHLEEVGGLLNHDRFLVFLRSGKQKNAMGNC